MRRVLGPRIHTSTASSTNCHHIGELRADSSQPAPRSPVADFIGSQGPKHHFVSFQTRAVTDGHRA